MKLKELLNNEKFLSKYGEYEIVGDSYTTLLQDGKSKLVFDVQKPKQKSVWDLGIREIYYDLHSDGQIHPLRYEGKESDEERILTGSAFRTKEEAEQDLERRKVETLLLKYGGRRWFRMRSICNYYMWVNTRDSLVVGCTGVGMQGLIYFDTREQAEKAIAEIGEERIIKALFEVR